MFPRLSPSVLLPLVVELMRPFMELPSWTFYVALTEMLLSLRLIHEELVVNLVIDMTRAVMAQMGLLTHPRRPLPVPPQHHSRSPPCPHSTHPYG